MRYESTLMIRYEKKASEITESDVPEQSKGNGGFMFNASIGRQFQLWKNPLSVNLQLCNITNRRNITTGGYEQSRSNYNVTERIDSESNETQFVKGNERSYRFDKNPKKFYSQGLNFMLNINYRF